MGKVTTKEAKLMHKIEENTLSRDLTVNDGWIPCDALVPAVLLNSKVKIDDILLKLYVNFS